MVLPVIRTRLCSSGMVYVEAALRGFYIHEREVGVVGGERTGQCEGGVTLDDDYGGWTRNGSGAEAARRSASRVAT